jgi:hypothetical protein
VRGLAADDAAERDIAVVAPRSLHRHGNGRRDLESAGNRDHVEGGRRQRRLGAGEQLVGEIVVETGLDDEEMGIALGHEDQCSDKSMLTERGSRPAG